MKRALVAVMVVFVVVETWLVLRAPSLNESMRRAFAEPATLMMAVDFTLFGGIVLVWMVSDAKKRGKNGWLWLPAMILAPTLALAAYLLAREARDSTKNP
jgi:cytochrome bd-type quinol oxidase subunit 2